MSKLLQMLDKRINMNFTMWTSYKLLSFPHLLEKVYFFIIYYFYLPLYFQRKTISCELSWPSSCWTRICPAFANSVDPDQLASSEANWSGCTLFAIKYVNLYQQCGLSNLIGWKLEMGMAS